MKSTIISGSVRMEAPSTRRITVPHPPPVMWRTMTMAIEPEADAQPIHVGDQVAAEELGRIRERDVERDQLAIAPMMSERLPMVLTIGGGERSICGGCGARGVVLIPIPLSRISRRR